MMYGSRNNRQIQEPALRTVGQTKVGRIKHISIREYDASGYPHPGLGEPRSVCTGKPMLVNLQKWSDLIKEVPVEKLELCNSCFREVR